MPDRGKGANLTKAGRVRERNCDDPFAWQGVTIRSTVKLGKPEMRVPDAGLESVVYLGRVESSGDFRAVGTGFLVNGRRPPAPRRYYLVTADHVVRKLGRNRRFAIRLNDRRHHAQIEMSPPLSDFYKWWDHPTDRSVDAAVFPWHLSEYPFTSIPAEKFIRDFNLREIGIGVGDEIFIIGLFRRWQGKDRIIPVVRHGHIAMMAGEPISEGRYRDAQWHLIEALALKGISGSPVFARQTVEVQIFPAPEPMTYRPQKMLALGDTYLLGLVHGYLPIAVSEEMKTSDPGQVWHSGISMVVPSSKIFGIIDQPELSWQSSN